MSMRNLLLALLLCCCCAANCANAAAKEMKGPLSVMVDSNFPPAPRDKGLQLRQEMAQYANDNADTFRVRKNYKSALREANEAIRMNACPDYYLTRARIYDEMDRPELAGQDWLSAVSGRPSWDIVKSAVDHFKRTKEYDRALVACDMSISDYPTCDAYLLRAQVNSTAGKSKDAIDDATKAYQRAFESGCDAKEEKAILKLLLGGTEPPLPKPKTEKTQRVLDDISAMDRSIKPFDPAIISKITTLKLYETPIENRPGVHTGSFEGRDDERLWMTVSLDRPNETDGKYRNCVNVSLNTALCTVTPKDVVARFGPGKFKPNSTTYCILDPAHLKYKRPWGTITFCFADSGFQSLMSVHLWVLKPGDNR